jgi:hypothetical protein
MNLYIAYNKRTCVTGKALFDSLRSKEFTPNISIRRTMTEPRATPDIVLRWGNSLTQLPENCVEINSQRALQLTADKAAMIRTLDDHEGVNVPSFALTREEAAQITDTEGKVFIRDRNDHVRYDFASNFKTSDKYALTPVEKVHEYRVHIFDGRTIGVYEKIPHDPSVKIYKNDTCDFVRIDQSGEGQRSRIKGIRPMSRAAVESLGLVFGGVDVLVDANNNKFITEVNSAPALNGPNLDRWANSIRDYVNSINTRGETAPTTIPDREELRRREEEQRVIEERRRVSVAREETRQNLISRLNELAEVDGFTITNLNLSDNLQIL